MHMPSHGTFLLETLVQHELKSGLVFGLDDFALNAACLNQSQAEVLIVCGADQHKSNEFMAGWRQVERDYAYRVLIVSEPIYSPLAFYLNPDYNAQTKHAAFIEVFQPHCVLYLSQYDMTLSAQQFGSAFERVLYSLADPALFRQTRIPWHEKRPALLYLGKLAAWEYSRSGQSERKSREQQVRFFQEQTRLPFAWSQNQFSFRQCYEVANEFCFQLQPRSGYAFHTARTVQSAIVGTIPVILLHPEEYPLLQAEAPFAKADHNLIVASENELELLIEKLLDVDFCQKIAGNVHQLLQAGTIQSGVQTLVKTIYSHIQG